MNLESANQTAFTTDDLLESNLEAICRSEAGCCLGLPLWPMQEGSGMIWYRGRLRKSAAVGGSDWKTQSGWVMEIPGDYPGVEAILIHPGRFGAALTTPADCGAAVIAFPTVRNASTLAVLANESPDL